MRNPTLKETEEIAKAIDEWWGHGMDWSRDYVRDSRIVAIDDYKDDNYSGIVFVVIEDAEAGFTEMLVKEQGKLIVAHEH